jgi:hypothetical protein
VHFVQRISAVAQDYPDGVFAGVNNLVEAIGGIKPITVEDYVAQPLSVRHQWEPSSVSVKRTAILKAQKQKTASGPSPPKPLKGSAVGLQQVTDRH